MTTTTTPKSLTARITWVRPQGKQKVRCFSSRTFDRVTRIELDFLPADPSSDRPAQARIWHQVWIPELQRYDSHVALICQDDDLDLTGILDAVTGEML